MFFQDRAASIAGLCICRHAYIDEEYDLYICCIAKCIIKYVRTRQRLTDNCVKAETPFAKLFLCPYIAGIYRHVESYIYAVIFWFAIDCIPFWYLASSPYVVIVKCNKSGFNTWLCTYVLVSAIHTVILLASTKATTTIVNLKNAVDGGETRFCQLAI